MKCTYCGIEYDDSSVACPNCGQANPSMQNGNFGYNQNAYSQGGYEQNQMNYNQGNYNQGGYNQGNYNQGNYNQGNYNQGGYSQGNYSQYNQGNYNQGYNGGGYRAPITQRNIAVAIILSLVTCGIYGIYWLVCLADDVNTAAGVQDTSGAMVFLLILVTCGIYGYYWFYKCGEKVAIIQQKSGKVPTNNALLYLLLSIFQLNIVNYILIQNELNQVASM